MPNMRKSKLTGQSQKLSIANWEIGFSGAEVTTEYIAPRKRYLARIDVRFEGQRRVGYYVWKLILPLVLVVMMSWAVFWIDPQHVAPRVGLAATSMLTLIAYRFALTASLPPIAYLTRMDIFLVGASVVVFGALAIAAGVSYVADSGRRELAGHINISARWLAPLLFVFVCGGALWW